MAIRRGTIFFVVFAVAVSAGCLRLGFWQLDRLRERKAANAEIMARLGEAPVPIERLRAHTGVRFRPATARGTYDFANEMVLTSRGRNGAPGVHVITPLRLATSDTAVLVNRGWVYSPDGMRIELAPFREDSVAIVEGYVEEFSPSPGPVSISSATRGVRRLHRDSLAAMLPYPIAPVVLVQQRDSGESVAVERGTPVRVEPPRMGEGPHLSYAIQWFGFALVGVAGSILVLQRDRARHPEGTNRAQPR
ncbi:MAG TPA: SURF1 family protein [Gemmatimonadaceae bacterium]